jgi:cobaltochelatase CobN
MRYVNISIGTKDSFLMNEAVNRVRAEGYDVDYHNYDNMDLDEDPLFLADAIAVISQADLVTIKVHGDTSYCKKFDKIEAALKLHHVSMHLSCTDTCVTDVFRDYFLGTDEEYDLVMKYAVLGGDDNFVSLLKWGLRKYDGLDVEIPEPVHP